MVKFSKDIDIDYLELLEKDLSQTLSSLNDSYKDIDSKAKYIAVAFIAFLGSLIGYVLTNFNGMLAWEKSFVSGMALPLLFCFLHLCDALRGRHFKVGVNPPSINPKTVKLAYLIAKIRSMKSMVEPNRNQCDSKGRAVNRAFISLTATAPVAVTSSVWHPVLYDINSRFKIFNFNDIGIIALASFLGFITICIAWWIGHYVYTLILKWKNTIVKI